MVGFVYIRGAVEGGSGGLVPHVKIKRVLEGSAPSIEHTLSWMNS